MSGVDAIAVEVEVQVKWGGPPSFVIIGLADNAVRESRDRVIAAIRHSGLRLPARILVNLAPAEVKKEGASFDLAIALGILAASGQICAERLNFLSFHGELSLDGHIKPVRGAVALALAACAQRLEEIIVPLENSAEAALIPGLDVTAVRSLAELVKYINENEAPEAAAESNAGMPASPAAAALAGFSDVLGQDSAKRAMLIAAAGGHNLLMIGPPGCGKSMLAARFPALLPPLDEKQRLEAVRIHSVAGLPVEGLLRGERPFRNPHHMITEAGLVGGGSIPRPGEISLAHNGVLFLDEFPEFRRPALEALRAPLEEGQVTVTRARASYRFPARFQLLAAMNPCPCGRLGVAENACQCSRSAIQQYLKKLSRPILDRIDLHIELEAVPFNLISRGSDGCRDEDQKLCERVLSALERQRKRQGGSNAGLSSKEAGRLAKLDQRSIRLIEESSRKLSVSARGYFRILKVALTISDLEDGQGVTLNHVAEAINLRGLDRIERYFS